jgi:sigma-B regulation protein RsbU (phosphoserine phosphatase)
LLKQFQFELNIVLKTRRFVQILGNLKHKLDFLSQKQINLYTGDVVVLYTDGITEAENESRQLYGVDRLCEVICQNVDASAIAILQKVIADLRSHIGTQKIYDDITLLVLKQK